MPRTFDIITTCKGRLEHLKRSLPRMLAQEAANVIVVDYSCPDGTGEYVREHFPSVRVVSVDEQEQFSNWRARNAGAKVANAQMLVFCDADTILADDAISWLSDHLPTGMLGHFERGAMRRLNTTRSGLAGNQLAGFLVVPRAAFNRIGGYDEVLEGYAAGGDSDLIYRLAVMGLKRFPLDLSIVSEVLEHDDDDRSRYHAHSMDISFCAGLIYRIAKRYLITLGNRVDLDLEVRKRLYKRALAEARTVGPGKSSIGITVPLEQKPIRMAPLVGYERGTHRVSMRIDLAFDGADPTSAIDPRAALPRR